ncbi:MAG: SpoIID/LytB domain-containing protein [Oscillospiraceae bacterium]|nr:SpoIID/LytB domain-containing protein [Oscillospiraceae bacterium]
MKYKLTTVIASAFLMLFIPLLSPVMHTQNTDYSVPLNDILIDYFKEDATSSDEEISHEDIEVPSDDLPVFALQFNEDFKILDEDSGKIITVSAIEYIRGAIAAEMPFTFHVQALAAQGVAAYTNAVRSQIKESTSPTPELKGADISARPSSLNGWTDEKTIKEWYGIYADAAWQKICEAADIASEYILIYDSEPIVAAYCSMSCGTTESSQNVWGGELPYLSSVESIGDKLAPDFATEVIIPPKELQNMLSKENTAFDFSLSYDNWFGEKMLSDSGYVLLQNVCGVDLTGQKLRSILSLRSACFDVSFNGTAFCFKVNGYGHGVGLSQYGADYMARQGCDFTEILQHYYKDVLIARVI